MSLSALGTRLRELRRALNLSQAQVAEQIGWHQTEVSALENGRQVSPTMETLVRLGSVYGLSPNELAELAGWWTGPPASPLDFYWSLIAEAATPLPDDRKHALLTRLANLARAERRVWEQEQAKDGVAVS
jgi:transcriptional regulator with XRE-family HTH domain